MPPSNAEIGIVGAGPAGAHLASRLAAAGREVILFDPKGAWEKPCGGGVPTRALREFSFILDTSKYPRKLIHRITLISPVERRVTIELSRPFAVYARQVFNGLLLDRALEAGARFIKAGVADFKRTGKHWLVRTDAGSESRVQFLVGADGAAAFTRRRLLGIFPKQDLALAFGYNVTEPLAESETLGNAPRDGDGSGARVEEVIVRFLDKFTGYLWAFPRPGAMNFGVASKLGEKSSAELKLILSDFVRQHYGGDMPPDKSMSFFGAKIPTLDLASWTGLRATGDGWALIGDAAGFADPITGEGIYYAIKSADLLADAMAGPDTVSDGRYIRSRRAEQSSVTASGSEYYMSVARNYERLWREAFGRELKHASYRLPHFYHGKFLGHVFTDAVVRLARHHRGVRTILERALTGEQSYVTLKRDLLRRAFQVF